jgi:hypothetical protein
MKTQTAQPRTKPKSQLTCPQCGNTGRFIETMAEEVHEVSGNGTYIRLLGGFADHYTCCECGEFIDPPGLEVK